MKSLNELTPFGVFMRKLRIKERENTLTMANKLGVTRGYLSQVEIGISPISLNLLGAIHSSYNLSEDERINLLNATVKSNGDAQRLGMDNIANEEREKILSYSYGVMLGLEEVK